MRYNSALVHSYKEYIAWLCRVYSDTWLEAPRSKVEETHGIPSDYPCRVWREKRVDPEPDWGSGITYPHKFMSLKAFNFEPEIDPPKEN